MTVVVLRSLVIALLVGAIAQLVSDLLFSEAAVPLPSYDAARAAAMPSSEAATYTHANIKRLSGLDFLAYSLGEPKLLALKIRTWGLVSAAIFVGCMLLAQWNARSAGTT